jgi:hypothetical protein
MVVQSQRTIHQHQYQGSLVSGSISLPLAVRLSSYVYHIVNHIFAAMRCGLIRRLDSFQFNSCQFNSCQFNSCQFNSCQFNSCQFNSCQFNSCHVNPLRCDTLPTQQSANSCLVDPFATSKTLPSRPRLHLHPKPVPCTQWCTPLHLLNVPRVSPAPP